MSAHPASHRRGWLSALVAHVGDYVLEPLEDVVEAEPVELEPFPVIAVVSAAPRCGATTVARLLAAELAWRADGASVVATASTGRRAAPPARAAVRLSSALVGAVDALPIGRLCVVGGPVPGAETTCLRFASHSGQNCSRVDSGDRNRAFAAVANAARYLAPVVLDVPADGSAARVARIADRVAVVGSAAGEPALLDAVAALVGGDPLLVVNRSPADLGHEQRFAIPESRLAARAAALGARAVGSAGSAIADLADALELDR